MKLKRYGLIALVLALIVVPFQTVSASLSGNLNINPNPSNWTNGNVVLQVETAGIDKVIMPNGTAKENKEYSFIGLNAKDEVVAIATHVVANIDRVGKDGKVNPNDSKWKNKNISVGVTVIESNKK